MIKRGSKRAMVLALLFVAFVAPASFGQPTGALAEAHDLYQRGRDGEALVKLKEVLASDPSAEAAFDMQNALEARAWARIMIKGDEHHAVVKQLFALAVPAAKAKQSDAETIKGLIAQLDSESWAERQNALLKLAADHGEYTVPHMLGRLGSADTARRAGAIMAMRNMGLQATMPLVQALEIDNQQLQVSALTALGMIRDPRALPYVAAAAADGSGMVTDAARKALNDMGGMGTDPAQAFMNIAEAYYARSPELVDPFRSTYIAWAQKDGELMAREVPRDIYHLKLAEEVLYDVLNWSPQHQGAQTLLCSVLVAQSVAAQGAGSGDEAGPTASLALAGSMAASMGPAIMDATIMKALADNRPEIAAEAVRLQGGMMSNGQVSAGLSAALNDGHKSVRFAAALALAGSVQGAEGQRVVDVLGEALGQDAVRTVVVIDDNAQSRNQIVADLNQRGYFAYGVASGTEGLAHIREYPIEDLAIVRYNLSDRTVSELIRTIRRDPKTADMPIAILHEASDTDAATSNYQDKAQAFIASPVAAGAPYEPGLRDLVKDVDSSRAEATATASAAAKALAMLPTSMSAAATSALMGTLKGDDSVRIPAMQALGKIGSGNATEALLGTFSDTTASETVRGTAAIALAQIARQGGNPSASVLGAIQEALKGEGSPTFWGHLGKACGILPTAASTRVELLNALRDRITVDIQK